MYLTLYKAKAKAAAKKKEINLQKTDAEHLLSSKESTRSWVNTMVSHLGDVNLLLQLQGDIMVTLNRQQLLVVDADVALSAPEEKFIAYKLAVIENSVGIIRKEVQKSKDIEGKNLNEGVISGIITLFSRL